MRHIRDPLPSTVVDDTFQKHSLTFNNTAGTPETVTHYVKFFDKDGIIAVCGVWVLLGKGAMDQLIAQWFDEATIVLNSRSNKIVSSHFIAQASENTQSKRATCVKSAKPATPALLNGHIGFDGMEVSYQ